MADTTDPDSRGSQGAEPAQKVTAPAASHDGPTAAVPLPPDRGQQHPAANNPSGGAPSESARTAHPWRRRLFFLVVLCGLAYGAYSLVPTIETALNTFSTDDAYVNGHVTFVAPRVSGQVSRVLVDDNYRVK
jgi:membrane fusion protein (multidrug efflux system)